MPRRLTPEQVEMVIEVANEVFPEWAARLEEMRASDPAGLDRAIASNARRLFSLAMVKRRNPELYELKVEELRNQMELRRVSQSLATARDSGAAAESIEALRGEIRLLATRQVDLELRTRAVELAAMDEAIRRMRDDLEADSNARSATIDALVAAVESGRPPEVDPERSDRGFGDRRDRMPPPIRERGSMPPRDPAAAPVAEP